MNDKNQIFYNNIGIAPFLELSEKGGFSAYKDLALISPFLKDTDDILELGAGYGRCLDYFIAKNHQGKLTGVEYSKTLVDFLTHKFNDKAEIIHADIKALSLNRLFNVALWMWSGIIDFSKEEQVVSCKRIFDHLKPGGILVLDLPRIGVQTIANHLDQQHLVFNTSFGEINAFIPSDEDIEFIKGTARFESVQKILYETTTDKKRTLYRFYKKKG